MFLSSSNIVLSSVYSGCPYYVELMSSTCAGLCIFRAISHSFHRSEDRPCHGFICLAHVKWTDRERKCIMTRFLCGHMCSPGSCKLFTPASGECFIDFIARLFVPHVQTIAFLQTFIRNIDSWKRIFFNPEARENAEKYRVVLSGANPKLDVSARVNMWVAHAHACDTP